MRRFGRIVPKAVLEEKLYGIDEEPDSNPIPVHVHHLRRQLEAAGASLVDPHHPGRRLHPRRDATHEPARSSRCSFG